MTAIALAVVGCSDDEIPGSHGNSFGQLTLAGEAIVGETLTASVTDANGLDESAIDYDWMANGIEIDGAESSSLVLTEALAGNAISVSVSYVDNDNHEERITSSATSAVFDPFANIEGSVTIVGSAKTGELLSATVTDDNGLENASFVYKWMATDDSGSMEIGTGGMEVHLTDNEVGKTISVEVSYTDDMGNDEMLVSAETSAVLGSDLVVSKTKAAVITDVTGGDAGELRYKGDDEVTAGKVNVRVLKNTNEAGKDAYIALYNDSTSTSNAIIDFKIKNDGTFFLRHSDGDVEVTGFTVTPGNWFDVELAWETTDEDTGLEELAEISIKIDGQEAGTYPTNSGNASLTVGQNFVRTVVFKLGDTGTIMDASESFIVDNLMFTNPDGSVVYTEDDFESYDEGHDLSSNYNSATQDAVVTTVDGKPENATPVDPVDPVDPNNLKVVQLTDTDDNDTAELRHKGDQLTEGMVSVSIRKDMGDISKDSYVSLYNSSTSSSNSFFDLRMHEDGTFEVRDNDQAVPATFNLSEWVDVVISWKGSSIDLTIDGVAQGTFQSQADNKEYFVETIALRMGDNGSVNTGKTYIDNLKIYSDEAGTTQVLMDDFESYTVGEVLGDGAGDDYNTNSSEAVVVDHPDLMQ